MVRLSARHATELIAPNRATVRAAPPAVLTTCNQPPEVYASHSPSGERAPSGSRYPTGPSCGAVATRRPDSDPLDCAIAIEAAARKRRDRRSIRPVERGKVREPITRTYHSRTLDSRFLSESAQPSASDATGGPRI